MREKGREQRIKGASSKSVKPFQWIMSSDHNPDAPTFMHQSECSEVIFSSAENNDFLHVDYQGGNIVDNCRGCQC